ncbi:MAG: PKD domain-containing protein, partial [Methanomassiliicoccales archaeon]|nr:PKD domain-containing protein [Methanomassiliicoccales archaeon]
WDADSYSETSFTLLINDPAPVADFTFTNTQNAGEISFSAALSSDTENDQDLLQYRWNFEGTWTSWNYSYEIAHTFQNDGQYSVKLEVKDDHNTPTSKTRNVTIDLLPPVISITDPVFKAEVAKPIVIYASVTDVVGVESVLLEYTIDNVTRTVVMTLDDSGEYFGQIPAQNHSTEITYRVIAEDRAGHMAYTDPFVISVEYEDSTLFVVSSALLLLALLVLLTYLFLSRPIVDEVFVMYHNGTLLAHQTRRLKPGMDDEILGGMLIALQNFVRDSFKDESSTVLSRMDFGDRKILVERKDDFFLAVLLSGKRAGGAPQRMLKVLDSIEDNYSKVLKEWDGDLEKVRGIRDETKPIFQRTNPLDRIKLKEGDGDSF